MNDRDFDNIRDAQNWIDLVENSHTRDADIYPFIAQWMDRHDLRRILDLGCGQGICSSKLPLLNRDYFGVDPSRHLLVRARTRYASPGRTFTQGSAYDIPFPSSSFDSVFSLVLWHLLEDIDKASKEVARVLNPGGKFLLITANPENYNAWTSGYSSSSQNGIQFKGTTADTTDTLYLHSLDSISASLRQAKFKITNQTLLRNNTFVALECSL